MILYKFGYILSETDKLQIRYLFVKNAALQEPYIYYDRLFIIRGIIYIKRWTKKYFIVK